VTAAMSGIMGNVLAFSFSRPSLVQRYLDYVCPPCLPSTNNYYPRWSYPDPMPTSFQWGELSGLEFRNAVSSTYDEIVHCKHNLLLVPSDSSGKSLVLELSRLYQAYVEHSSLEAVTLKAYSIFVALVLQKRSRTSKNKDHLTFQTLGLSSGGRVRFFLSWMRVTAFSGTLDLVVHLIRMRLPVISIS